LERKTELVGIGREIERHDSREFMIRKTLGRYQTPSRLGKGGMDEVRLVDGLNLNRKVVLHLILRKSRDAIAGYLTWMA
jgi:hypothetical protein